MKKNGYKKIKILLLLIILQVFVFIAFNFFLAPDTYADNPSPSPATNPSSSPSLHLQIPIFQKTEATSISDYIGSVYSAALYIIIPLAIIVIIFAGAEWIGAAGDGTKIQNAKSRIIFAFIGLGIALFSYLLLSLFGLTTISTPGLTNLPAENIQQNK